MSPQFKLFKKKTSKFIIIDVDFILNIIKNDFLCWYSEKLVFSDDEEEGSSKKRYDFSPIVITKVDHLESIMLTGFFFSSTG